MDKAKKLCWLALLFFACAPQPKSAVEVSEAWVREPPGGHPIAAAYMLLKNATAEAQVLVAAECDAAERVEIHLMEHQDGKMKMRQMQSLQIPAEGTIALEPGGLHLMLMGMEQAPKAGEELELTLRFADGSEQIVQAAVRRGSYAD